MTLDRVLERVYLTKYFSLTPDPKVAYEQAADLCRDILDLVLGSPAVRKCYRHLRNEHDQSQKKVGDNI